MSLKMVVEWLIVVVLAPLWVPVMVVLTLLNIVFNGWPPFFTQLRGGFGNKPFRLFKFRTMTNARDAQGQLLPDADRMTRFGAILRATSLDELPSLFNVLKGDMVIIGPRPFIADYLPLYNEEQRRRHEVRPGITGWAQVNGRNQLSWQEKFGLDVWYVDNRSIWLDCKIVLLTVRKVFARDGVNSDEHATMPRFTGNDD